MSISAYIFCVSTASIINLLVHGWPKNYHYDVKEGFTTQVSRVKEKEEVMADESSRGFDGWPCEYPEESWKRKWKRKKRGIKPLNMTYSEEPFRQINFTFVWLWFMGRKIIFCESENIGPCVCVCCTHTDISRLFMWEGESVAKIRVFLTATPHTALRAVLNTGGEEKVA